MAEKITIIKGDKGTGMGLFSVVMTYKLIEHFNKIKVLGGKG